MVIGPGPQSALYDHFGWRLAATPVDTGVGRLTETHEYFHRQLDDTTAFGGLMSAVAALAEAVPTERWQMALERLRSMSDVVHESFAVGTSLLTTQRAIEYVDDYPTYDRYVRTVQQLVGAEVHPWVSLVALRAAALVSMQSAALASAVVAGIRSFEPSLLPTLERPNHRLAALLSGSFADAVEREEARARREFSAEPWWRPEGGMLLAPEAMEGSAGEAYALTAGRLLEAAGSIVQEAGGHVVALDGHHDGLRALLGQARDLSPHGLVRIGALVEAPGGDLTHGGPLDGQTIELSTAPRRAVVLPYGSVSGASGEGPARHTFVVVTTPDRLRAAHDLEGVPLTDGDAVACVRTTVYEGERRDAVLLLPVDRPEVVDDTPPAFVCILSSAVAAAPEQCARWMRWAGAARLSLVMDTPATAALRRWCTGAVRFRTETRAVAVEGAEIRVIAGRLEEPGRLSPLVLIPTTEFGARWFEAVRAEDARLNTVVVDDPGLFERESDHLDVLLTHMLLEERFLGTGSWRR